MTSDASTSTDWAAVSARSQAFLCLKHAGLDDGTMVEKARFLMTLGLARVDAAGLLGTSDDSLRVQLAQAAKKAGAKAPTKKAVK